MQTIDLTINKEITAIGNITIPEGAIGKCELVLINLAKTPFAHFRCFIYANQGAVDSGEPIMVKGIHEMGPRGSAFSFGLDVSSDDFTLETDNACCLTQASLDSAKEKIKSLLANDLEGVETTDIV
jgi:hypothetical protein